MGRIHVLSDSLINRIAAGEVVERPASVVKELVENAIDSGARSVAVVCEAGGRARVRVEDDGCGMDRDDALLAIERHATSKISSAADLETIGTLGFRGEALSSIAAVSRFSLLTCTGEGSGTQIEVDGGRIESVREVGGPRGTTIDVQRLFFNVPARRKFLRAESTELGHIARLVTRFALAFPALRFELLHGTRRLLRVDPAAELLGRAGQLYGREFAARLLPFDAAVEGLRVHGLTGRPAEALTRRDGQHLFVNGRAVQDRLLFHAVSQAYGNTLPHGRHPAVFLFVEIAPEAVDVNVHPQKHEVRFRRSSEVHDFVRATLSSALSQNGAVPSLSDLRPSPERRAEVDGVARATLAYLDAATAAPALREPARAATAWRTVAAPRVSREAPAERLEGPAAPPRVSPLAQYRDSYIVAQDEDGLLLIDQHAAHERVLFERFLDDATSNRVEIQRLMFPVTVELGTEEWIAFEREIEEFRRLGFLVEPFGERTARIDGVPALAAEVEPEPLLRELLGEAGRARSAVADATALRHRLVTSAACQAAIKIRHPLTPAAMQGLLDDLFRTANPGTCPHGRPLVFRLPLDEIERAFHRR